MVKFFLQSLVLQGPYNCKMHRDHRCWHSNMSVSVWEDRYLISRAPKPGNQDLSVLPCYQSKTPLQGDLNSYLVMTLSLCCDNSSQWVTWISLWSQAGHLSCVQVGEVKHSFTQTIFFNLPQQLCIISGTQEPFRIPAAHTQKATAADLKSK